jgi:hypothetical protein
LLRHVFWWKVTDVSVVLTASIIMALMVKAVNASETSVTFYQTTCCNIPEESAGRHEYLYARESETNLLVTFYKLNQCYQL